MSDHINKNNAGNAVIEPNTSKAKIIEDGIDRIHIADEVLSALASIAVSKIPSVAPSSTSVGEGLAGFLGMKTSNKGIRIETTEKGVSLEVYVTMEYGCKLHTTARQIQDTIRTDIEEMTGMRVLAVNVHVMGVNLKELREQKALKEGKDRDTVKDKKDGKGNAAELAEKIEIAAIVAGTSAGSSASNPSDESTSSLPIEEDTVDDDCTADNDIISHESDKSEKHS